MDYQTILGTSIKWSFIEAELQQWFGNETKFGEGRRIEIIGVGQVSEVLFSNLFIISWITCKL